MTTSAPSPSPTASLAALQAFVQAMPVARTLGLRFVHAEAGRVEVEIRGRPSPAEFEDFVALTGAMPGIG